MNKKVALLTFHNAANYGAVLQTYALQRYLETIGVYGEYINYENISRKQMYDMGYLFRESLSNREFIRAAKYLLGSMFMRKRQQEFKNFVKNYINVTSEIYTCSDQAKQLNGKYDYFIVGSDMVWNPINNGEDFAYLLDFVEDNEKKISYSPSFGIAEIPQNLLPKYKECITSIKALATRERAGVQFIKNLTGRDAIQNLDPVFLLSAEEWKKLEMNQFSEKYVFTYTNSPGQFERFLKTTNFKMEGYKEYILSSSTKPGDFLNPNKKVKFSISPNDFLSIIDDANLIVTASFHCIAFAIIFHKPFVAVLLGDSGQDERLVNLLKVTGLTNRILTDNLSLEEVYKPIDYEEVDKKLGVFIEDSKRFLNNSIFGE